MLKDFVAVTLLGFMCLKCRAVVSCQSIVKTQTALDGGEDNKSGLHYFFLIRNIKHRAAFLSDQHTVLLP